MRLLLVETYGYYIIKSSKKLAIYPQTTNTISVDQVAQHRYHIEKQIVDLGIDKYADGTIEKDELAQIADFTADGMDKVKTHQDLVDFVNSLTSRWPFFQNIATLEQGEIKEAVDREVYDGVLALAKHGKIDQAVKLAKTATNVNN